MVAFSYEEYKSIIPDKTKIFVNFFINYLYSLSQNYTDSPRASHILLCAIEAYNKTDEKNASVISSLDIINIPLEKLKALNIDSSVVDIIKKGLITKDDETLMLKLKR